MKIGLKDALAVLTGKSVVVHIHSSKCSIRLDHHVKVGFDDIMTLHAFVVPPIFPDMQGTEFRLFGLRDQDLVEAKEHFLAFVLQDNLVRVLDEVGDNHGRVGDIIDKNGPHGVIYLKGVRVAEEPNFTFSYNIIRMSAAMKKAINREKTHVGRVAYTGTISLYSD